MITNDLKVIWEIRLFVGSSGMPYKFIYISVLSAMVSLPTVGYADEAARDPGPESESYYSGLEDLSLRRDISGINHFYFVQPQVPAFSGGDIASDGPYADVEGGSAGGYISFAAPSTSTILGFVPEEKGDSWIDGVEFSVDWRADVSGGEHQDYRRIARSFAGSEIDRVGVRADLTALLYDETLDNSGSTAWRVTGMLGSTSLSLLAEDESMGLGPGSDSGGLLWDIGVGWSSGAMSLNAGYQSAYSLNQTGEEESAIAVLSLGADYAILPGFSIYGELNVIDGPPDENEDGLGTVVIVGTGVSF
jgi:hypothetical protein